jgi:acid phosphatase (class A)
MTLPIAAQNETVQTAVTSLPANVPRGYMDPEGLPNSLALLPPPPAPNSPGFARDEAAREAAIKMKDSPRWTAAVSDADLNFPHAADTFSCAANLRISKETTPKLYALLEKAYIDVGLSTYRAKMHYERVRPFVIHNAPSCTPSEEADLGKDGSYPSGHSAVGWGWALILSELFPEHCDEILARGRDFGQSRIVCGVHWQSDVDAGRTMASATVARLHAVPAFSADLQDAQKEIDIARANGERPNGLACEAIKAALIIEP